MKVRIQSTTDKVSAMKVIKDLIKEEGPLAFYKGVTSPLVGVSFIVAI